MLQIWLKGSSKWFQFPVIPAEYTVSSDSGNESVTVNALGEVDLGGKRKLRTISFSSFFPKYYDTYCSYRNLMTPKKCVETIEELRDGTPPKLIITDTPVNFPCRVESFSWGENDATGDINFSITLKEHRPVVVTASAVVTLSSLDSGTTVDETGVARAQPEAQGKTYTVKKGDCLSAIARRMTGSASWQKLYEANKSVIGSNPNLIKPGQILTIPG